MKHITAIIFLLTISNLTNGQRTNFQTSQIDNVPSTQSTIKPNLENYPYLAVSVLFRNEDKLSDKKFLGNFNKMDFFFTEVSITYNSRTETSPLYLLKKEKGRFSTSVFKDRTVVRKMPINKYSQNIPTINVNTEIQIKNQTIEIVKTITDKVAPIIANPASIYGPAAAQLVFGFLDEVVTDLNDKRQINAKVGFDSFTPEETGILPYSYKVVIIRPNIVIPLTGFSIQEDTNKKLNLYYNNSLYNDYPYIIIQTGLSNYLDTEGIPSKFFYRRGNCNISANEYLDLQASFLRAINILSDDQIAAEQITLDLYKYKLSIAEGVDTQGQNPNEQKLLSAYNSLFEFRNKLIEINIDQTLRQEHYDTIYKSLITCINSSANSLSIYRQILLPVFNILEKELDKIDNSALSTLTTYIENTKNLDFIVNSKFHSNVVTLQHVAENYIFINKFQNHVKKISSANIIDEELKTNMIQLIDLKNKNDKCKLCLDESQKAEKLFNNLVDNQEIKRNEILQTVEQSNIAYSKGYAALQKLEFVITKSIDSTTFNSTIFIPIDKTEFEITIKNLKANKEMLNEKLSKINFSRADMNEILNLTMSCNTAISEIDNVVDIRLLSLFENYIKAFSIQ
jgi:hypothetical protein